MAEIPKTHLVTASAWVEPDTHVVLIEAPILRRLQAEHAVMQEICAELDWQVERLVADNYYTLPDPAKYEGWKIRNDFEVQVQKALGHGRADE